MLNNLGGLYFAVDYMEQAQEAHLKALQIRTNLFGKDHIETAQSYANLALAYCQLDGLEQAEEHFKKAYHIYEEHAEQAQMDFAAVAANYEEFLRSQDREKEAQEIEKKTHKRLKRFA